MRKRRNEATRALSAYEQNVLLPILMKGLQMKKGKKNAVTNNQMVEAVRKHGVKINYRSMIMVINHIRTNDLIVGLMASSLGYYITDNEHELINYEESLQKREMALRKVRMSMQRQRQFMFQHYTQKQMQMF